MKDALNKAIIIAAKTHRGKKGRNREPALLHPLRVMSMMNDNNSRIAAILHDVVESRKITIKDLQDKGFNDNILIAVDLLSKRKGEEYIHYINRLKGNKIALKVKLADLIDNYIRRKKHKVLSKNDKQKIKKYKKAYTVLTGQTLKSAIKHL
jgi:(p)ppGpp synthase/HD superfamily hydrolase|tara:strand:- start:489 stop:944 length:456 start_codon:yes stop_codon:yes gene_type:complete